MTLDALLKAGGSGLIKPVRSSINLRALSMMYEYEQKLRLIESM